MAKHWKLVSGLTPLNELERLQAIEAAAQRWRVSLEEDGWTEEDIKSGICRSGMSDLMFLLTSRSHPPLLEEENNRLRAALAQIRQVAENDGLSHWVEFCDAAITPCHPKGET
jgi:hypothetical protein